ncbi:MAG: SUMF1/EgtB/PvdO family nonheme iron enzyme, partial [Bacteroidales bacterium]|nr:SUMF1/EgtB/PvdO family nonheme iron enzyme [Bacteroidales bacterium]
MEKRILTFILLLIISIVAIAQQNSEMTLIPEGEFFMGNDLKNGLGYSPVHKVKVDSFYIDKYEVT